MGWMDFHEYLLLADLVRDRLDDLRRTADSEQPMIASTELTTGGGHGKQGSIAAGLL